MPEIVEYDLNMSFEQILSCCDLEQAHYQTKEGYVDVTYVDAPICSTNTSRFVENDFSKNCIDFDTDTEY